MKESMTIASSGKGMEEALSLFCIMNRMDGISWPRPFLEKQTNFC